MHLSSWWLPTQAPVYATVPVQRMGQVTMRDACRARAEATEAPPFSLADVDRAFSHITQLRWRQTVNLPGALSLHSHVLRWFDVRRCIQDFIAHLYALNMAITYV
jgi:Cft2 family RNA processing exonuclease